MVLAASLLTRASIPAGPRAAQARPGCQGQTDRQAGRPGPASWPRVPAGQGFQSAEPLRLLPRAEPVRCSPLAWGPCARRPAPPRACHPHSARGPRACCPAPLCLPSPLGPGTPCPPPRPPVPAVPTQPGGPAPAALSSAQALPRSTGELPPPPSIPLRSACFRASLGAFPGPRGAHHPLVLGTFPGPWGTRHPLVLGAFPGPWGARHTLVLGAFPAPWGAHHPLVLGAFPGPWGACHPLVLGACHPLVLGAFPGPWGAHHRLVLGMSHLHSSTRSVDPRPPQRSWGECEAGGPPTPCGASQDACPGSGHTLSMSLCPLWGRLGQGMHDLGGPCPESACSLESPPPQGGEAMAAVVGAPGTQSQGRRGSGRGRGSGFSSLDT